MAEAKCTARAALNSVFIAARAPGVMALAYGATSKLKSPSVTCVSTDRTRHITRYVPGASCGSGTVDFGIARVDLLAAAIQHTSRAEGGLEALGKPQFELRRRAVNRATDSRCRMVQESVGAGMRCE